MASYTENLNLFKKNPLVELDDAFNIRTMLNENWDKLDKAFGDISSPFSSLGLTGDVSVAKVLNVLANIGNVHVWERVQDGVTDYLTSNDRNAYPDNVTDAQDAYYTLGDESKNVMIAGENYQSYADCALFYSDSVSVNDIGDVSLNNPSSAVYKMSEWPSNFGILAGKFVRDQDNPSTIYYLPADVSIINNSGLVAKKSQRVIGHAAIPANTTITYLGQIGGAARVETGYYVGTGTYGVDNPNILTLRIPPELVVITSGSGVWFLVDGIGFSPTGSSGQSNYMQSCAIKGNSVSWYTVTVSNAYAQANVSGEVYNYFSIGSIG